MLIKVRNRIRVNCTDLIKVFVAFVLEIVGKTACGVQKYELCMSHGCH